MTLNWMRRAVTWFNPPALLSTPHLGNAEAMLEIGKFGINQKASIRVLDHRHEAASLLFELRPA